MTVTVAAKQTLAPGRLREMFRQMVTIRRVETRVIELYREGSLRGSTHTYAGEEAIAVGACAALRPDDYIASTHRGHGHCLAKGAEVGPMMAELFGKATGYCKGKGGSMHIADVDTGNLGANGIVGGGIGLATGAALATRVRGADQVAIAFFGDGAINQGTFHECANLGALWKLPVVYICENNQFAMSTRIEDSASVRDLTARAVAFGFPGVNVDGMDVLAVYQATAEAVARARAGDGPTLLVCTTYRFAGHYAADTLHYVPRDEVEAWRARDPIPRFRHWLVTNGLMSEVEAQAIDEAAAAEVEAAIEFARQSPDPDPELLEADVYAPTMEGEPVGDRPIREGGR